MYARTASCGTPLAVPVHDAEVGELDGAHSPSMETIAPALIGAGFDARLSETIRQDIWEKWIFIATVAGITCLMRAAIGDIVAAGAADLAVGLLDECAAIAGSEGYPPRAPFLERVRATVGAPGSPLMASMLRDIEGGMRTEGDHILGDLLRRAGKPDDRSLLRIAYAHVKAYELRRMRSGTASE